MCLIICEIVGAVFRCTIMGKTGLSILRAIDNDEEADIDYSSSFGYSIRSAGNEIARG
jgi:hypothetical protein